MAEKNICEVDIIDSMTESTNILVEESGGLRRLNLQTELDKKIDEKLGDIESLLAEI